MPQCGFLCVTPQHSHEKYFMTLTFSVFFVLFCFLRGGVVVVGFCYLFLR